LPDVELPGLPGLDREGSPVPGFPRGQFHGRVTVLNVWASWCPYCRGEHGHLMRLAGDRRFTLVGLVYRDNAAKARDYLLAAGNPYAAVAADPEGRLAQALRQSGVPSTYVVNRSGRLAASFQAALDPDIVRKRLFPAILAALESPAAA
jgi:cytochrome c biogenesis protein CcmG/thiol:disulfide interchange protein DsbE